MAKAGLAALLLASICRAFFGAPASRPRPRRARQFLGVAAVAYAAGCMALLAGAFVVAAVLAVGGVEAACASAWLARSAGPGGGDDDGGGGGPGDEPAGPPPWNWDEFDRARSGWSRRGRPREPTH